MSAAKPTRISLPPPRFGDDDDTVSDTDNVTPVASPPRPGARVSFSQRKHRPSRNAVWRAPVDEESGMVSPAISERPPIPSALVTPGETLSTPLPVLPMIVLSIVSVLPA